MRVRDWRFVYLFLILCGLTECLFAASTSNTVLLPVNDPATYRNLQDLSKTISRAPSIFIGAGAPSFSPSKQGDIFISTTTSKVYISTAMTNSSSWALMN